MKRFTSPATGAGATQVAVGPVADCHQHLWPEAFIEQLRRRTRGPRLVGWELHLDGEPSYAVDPAAHQRLAPVLAVVEAADLPVLVHPGPALSAGEVPGWWPALTSYTAQLTAAWYAWHVAGRSLLPRLRIAFVGLAGLAPLHHE